MSTSAVRMTFQTDRPFYPYREPAGAPPVNSGPTLGRLLRVYFVAEGRVKGTRGEDGPPWGQVASSRVVWAGKRVDVNREGLLRQMKLPAETPPASWWLTVVMGAQNGPTRVQGFTCRGW